MYRIAVGKRQRVEPRQIVGALANEGGLRRDDFGAIDIRPDFSLVELPANLSRETLDRLSETRISGRLIELRPDSGRPQRRSDAGARSFRDDRGSGSRSYGDRPRDDRGSGSRGSYAAHEPTRARTRRWSPTTASGPTTSRTTRSS